MTSVPLLSLPGGGRNSTSLILASSISVDMPRPGGAPLLGQPQAVSEHATSTGSWRVAPPYSLASTSVTVPRACSNGGRTVHHVVGLLRAGAATLADGAAEDAEHVLEGTTLAVRHPAGGATVARQVLLSDGPRLSRRHEPAGDLLAAEAARLFEWTFRDVRLSASETLPLLASDANHTVRPDQVKPEIYIPLSGFPYRA